MGGRVAEDVASSREHALMRRSSALGRLVIPALSVALLLPAAAAARPSAGPGATPAVAQADQVIVTWAGGAGASEAAAPARLAALGAAAGSRVGLVRLGHGGVAIYRLGRALGHTAAADLAALRRVPGVAAVEPDILLTAADLPDDTHATELWGLIDGAPGGSPFGIDAVGAWPYSTGAGVVVAVVDTGLVAHPDLAGQTVAGYDFISDPATANDGSGRDANPSDPGDWVTQNMCGPGTTARSSSWHGTHVAGTIAALANNALGVFGGAPSVKLQPVRVLGRCGGLLSDVADGIRWSAGGTVAGVPANATPARVINLSLTGQSSCSSYLSSAITSARNNGAVVVAAAGNSNANAANFSPGNCSGVLTVAATDANGQRAPFSNYDPNPANGVVEVAAPGVAVLSTIDAGTTTPATPTYGSYSGTSMAAPHVALTVALVLAVAPTMTAGQVEALLELTSTPFAPDASPASCSSARRCGEGIVGAARAVASAAGAGAPGAPTGTIASAGDAQALVSWNAPASAGSSPISGYTVTARPDGATCATSGELSCAVTGLANGTAYTFTVVATNEFGTSAPGTASAPVTPAPVDRVPPVVTPVVAALRAGLQLGTSKIPLVLSWSGLDASGVSAFVLQQSRNGGAWTSVALPNPVATTLTLMRPPGSTFRFRVRATDTVGNTSAWVLAATFKLVVRQESNSAIGYAGTWTRAAASTAYGGALRYAKASTARATMSFTGSSVAWVAKLSSQRGAADVYVDGALAATVDLYSPTTLVRQIVFTRTWATPAKHTIQIRVRGTAGRPRVEVDALVFLK